MRALDRARGGGRGLDRPALEPTLANAGRRFPGRGAGTGASAPASTARPPAQLVSAPSSTAPFRTRAGTGAGTPPCSAAGRAGRDGTPLGLFDGIAGPGFGAALWPPARALRRNAHGDRRADHRRHRTVLGRVAERSQGAVGGGLGPISGMTGIGVYLLGRRDQPGRAPLSSTSRGVVDLMSDDGNPPRWSTPPSICTPTCASTPAGNLNCGLAHGVPGPLALCRWRSRQASRSPASWRPCGGWPTGWRPSPSPAASGPSGPRRPSGGRRGPAPVQRPALPGWCYGNAGVALALWPSRARWPSRASR